MIFEIEKIVDLAKGVRVGPAHEAVADQSDIKFFHSGLAADKKTVWVDRRKREKPRVELRNPKPEFIKSIRGAA